MQFGAYDLPQGPDPPDPVTRGRQATDPMPTLARGVRGLRLARLPAAERRGAEADVLDAYDRLLAVLAGLGAEIVDSLGRSTSSILCRLHTSCSRSRISCAVRLSRIAI